MPYLVDSPECPCDLPELLFCSLFLLLRAGEAEEGGQQEDLARQTHVALLLNQNFVEVGYAFREPTNKTSTMTTTTKKILASQATNCSPTIILLPWLRQVNRIRHNSSSHPTKPRTLPRPCLLSSPMRQAINAEGGPSTIAAMSSREGGQFMNGVERKGGR